MAMRDVSLQQTPARDLDWPALSAANPVLAALPEGLRGAARRRGFAGGETLARRGSRPGAMLYVLDGEVRLTRHTAAGAEVILQRSRNGFIAEGSMEARSYHCDVVASEQGSLLGFPIPAFRQALDADPVFRRAWIARLSGEVRRLRAQNERLHLNTAAERVLHYIESEGKDGVIDLPVTRKAWAVELGLSHEALYRTLRRMETEGLVSIQANHIAIG
jgi:CRP/FNR family transcriptional regulator, dissimilatory nitrate respiration regulator